MKNLHCPEKGDDSTSSSTNITHPCQRPDADTKYEIESPSRRQFLAAAAATVAASTVGFSSLSGAATARAVAHESTTFSLQKRRARAFEIRERAAIFQLQRKFPDPQNNGDEGRYPDGIASFGKALPHKTLGEVDRNAYRKLLQAINSSKPSDFDQVPLGGTARLANPQSAFAFELEGADPHSLSVQPPPRFASEEFAGEMVEDYWRGRGRGIPI
jgi:hypothetical protein